jgi:HSP20 family protein
MATKITPRHESGNGKQVPSVFESMTSLRDEMNHLFDDFFTGSERRMPSMFRTYEPGWLLGTRRGEMTPAVDVSENDQAIVMTAELPGMKEEDVDLVLRDDMLTVRGEKKSEREEEKENYHLSERRYGSFERTFRLPEMADAEHIKAAIEDGVLTVTIPKKPEAKVAEKKIKIGK